MKIFYTNSAEQFSEKINLSHVGYSNKKFSDGEIYIKVDQDVQQKEIWVVASTQSPADNLLELFFLLDALRRAGAQKINLFITYFGYARQIMPLSGEAGSAQFICHILNTFSINTFYIIHAHAALTLHSLLNFKNCIDLDFFCSAAKNYDVIAAPDKGAFEFAQQVAQACNKEIVFLHKVRPEHEKVRIESIDGTVSGKKVILIDDIISTGNTIIEACKALKQLGATEVAAAATHGIFTAGACEKLQESPLTKIYVTNTLDQCSRGKIEVYDISKFIETLLVTS